MQPPVQCPPLIIWRPVPDKSLFKASVSGDESVFEVQMDVECASQPSTTLPKEELTPGPATIPINAGDHCTFDLLLNITGTPPDDKPVIVSLRIVDENDVVVMVSDGAGGTRPAQCASQFTTATGNKPVGIVIVAVADK